MTRAKTSQKTASDAARLLEKAAKVQARAIDGRIVRLGDPEAADNFEALTARLRNDREFALNLLRRTGIVTARGNLSKRFGG